MVQKFSCEWGGKTLSLEVGKLTNQTNGACVAQYGETVVLATAVMSENKREGIDFFPLMVEFDEKLYAAGIIKGSRFIKREGRPTDEAILSGRLIDRAIRPLFDDRIRNDIQVVVSVLSFDGENDPDFLGLVAASCALHISDIPWDGPIGGTRVGQINGELVLNPSYEARLKSTVDMVVAGTTERVLMLEASANEALEETAVQAIAFGQKHLRPVLQLIEEVRAKVGRPKTQLEQDLDADPETAPSDEDDILNIARQFLSENIDQYFFSAPVALKAERLAAFNALNKALDEHFQSKNIGKDRRKVAFQRFKLLVEEFIMEKIMKKNHRVDGRKLTDIRSLSAEVGILPRTHGSALFNRGETQVLSTVTLGSPAMVQTLEGVEGTSKKRYMHHYNFPPFCVGEAGAMRGPGRREIGHGALAEKALVPVLPDKESFPYTIRVVSEVLGSNGSSSMGSTCGSSLALMDAGVPIKTHVAGIAIGLASDGEDYRVLTDLQDLEDGKGGMDFKVAGTVNGLTAIQMDTKTKGLTSKMVTEALERGRQARLEVLAVMNKAIPVSRPDLSPYAPRIISFRIPIDKIREVIGPGGKMINSIIEATGVEIDIEDDGLVSVTAVNKEAMEKAAKMVKDIIRELEPGEVFDGKVTRLMDFGAFVECLPGKEGLVHISEMSWNRVGRVEDVLNVGDAVKVKVKEIDSMGRVNLTMKELLPRPEGYVEPAAFERRPSGFRPRGGGGRDDRRRRF